MSEFKVGMPDGTEVKHNYLKNSESAQQLLAKFHGNPGVFAMCLCNEGTILKLAFKKRNAIFLATYPNTSSLHHTDCPHYQPAPDILTANDALTKDARREINGRVYISCDVGLTRRADKEREPGEESEENENPSLQDEEVSDDGSSSKKANLKKVGLLHLLLKFWLDAQLNQWMPGFVSKRSWSSVRSRLLSSTKNVYINKLPMTKGLYIPQSWHQDKSQEISAAKETFFSCWRGEVNKDFICIGELKDIEPSEHGYQIKLKHESLPFYISNDLYNSMNKAFPFPLTIYANQQTADAAPGKVIVIMTCNMPSKYMTVRSIALMGMSNTYIPVLSRYELSLVDHLVDMGRTFIRPAKIDIKEYQYPDFVLLDTGEQTVMGIIDDSISDMDEHEELKLTTLNNLDLKVWTWKTYQDDHIPNLPPIDATFE